MIDDFDLIDWTETETTRPAFTTLACIAAAVLLVGVVWAAS